MARTTVTQFTSDLTGNPIEGEAAEVRIKVNGKLYVGDAGADEVADLVSRFQEKAIPGRKSADESKAKAE